MKETSDKSIEYVKAEDKTNIRLFMKEKFGIGLRKNHD